MGFVMETQDRPVVSDFQIDVQLCGDIFIIPAFWSKHCYGINERPQLLNVVDEENIIDAVMDNPILSVGRIAVQQNLS